MAQDFDVIIVGGGSNGLIIGSYLAKAGQKRLLLSTSGRPSQSTLASSSSRFVPEQSPKAE